MTMQKTRDASQTANATVVGYMLNDIKKATTPKGKEYAYFLMSGDNDINYSVRLFDSHMIAYAEKSLKKQSLVMINGEINSHTPKGEHKMLLGLQANQISLLAEPTEEKAPRVRSSSMLSIFGSMKTNVEIKQTSKGVNYAEILVAGNNFDYSVRIFDENTVIFLNRNARKGTKLEISGKFMSLYVGKNENYNPIITVMSSNIKLTGNFGEAYVATQDQKQRATA